MKKILFAILIPGLLMTASCSKPANSNPGGQWTFEQNTYNTSTAVGSTSSNTLVATGTTSTGTPGGVTFHFINFPTVNNSTYTVVAGGYPNTTSQVGITASIGNTATAANYTSTGGNGTGYIYVTVTNGKISVSGSTIEMRNNINPADSSALEFTINQLTSQ